MSVPGIVESAIGDQDIAARVSLRGDDELFVTPSSTVIYRSDGLLSDESLDEYPHDADKLELSEGRRKARFTLEYALDGERDFTVPASKTDDVLHPVLAGILNGNGITDPGETVIKTYRFSELAVIVTSNRLVKHVGSAVWDTDYEQYHYEEVTHLSFEEGSVATQIVLAVDGRPQRIKAPNEEAPDIRERLKRALLDYHDVPTLAAFNEQFGPDEDESLPKDGRNASVAFDGVEPLGANPPDLSERSEPTESMQSDIDDEEIDPISTTDHPGTEESARPERISAQTNTVANDSHPTETESAESIGEEAVSTSSTESTHTEPVSEESRIDPSNKSRTDPGGTTSETGSAEADMPVESTDDPQSQSSWEWESNLDADKSASTTTPTSDTTGENAETEPTDDTPGKSPEIPPVILDQLEELEETVEQQATLLERQRETIERLIDDIRSNS